MSDRTRRTRTVEELRLEVDRRAIAQLEELLKPEAIEDTIKQIFHDRVESIVCSALGYERDTWEHWKLKEHSSEKSTNAVRQLIFETAEGIAKQMMPTLLTDVADKLKLKQLLTKKARSIAKDLFNEACYHELSAKLKDDIDAKADTAVAAALREKFEVRLAADLRTDEERKRGRY